MLAENEKIRTFALEQTSFCSEAKVFFKICMPRCS